VWPNPPAITRIKYLNYFAGEKLEKQGEQVQQQKVSWKDRLAGTDPLNDKKVAKARYALGSPYGMAVDSKGRLYVADTKVGAVFVFNTETGEIAFIRNGHEANLARITGLAMDDTDRLFVSDNGQKHVLVYDIPKHKVEASISEGMVDPAGIAIDNENRFLYVCDTTLDQVLVYDADNFKLLRKIGTSGQGHTLTTPGDFAAPSNAVVDGDGNLYVTDTLNNRVEIFDADGKFVHTFGKAGDGPGYFARPKGIAVDSDGHVWVADAMQDRVQVFTPEGKLLIWMGGHGLLPGQFRALAGLAIDKNNRVFTSEQFPGRVQMFRYFTNDEAKSEKERRDAGQKPASTQAAAPEVAK
jgi:DNA-binding beta-propeller fold protein YncE